MEYCKGCLSLLYILMEFLYRIFESETMEETILFYDAINASHFPLPCLCVLPLAPMGWDQQPGSVRVLPVSDGTWLQLMCCAPSRLRCPNFGGGGVAESMEL